MQYLSITCIYFMMFVFPLIYTRVLLYTNTYIIHHMSPYTIYILYVNFIFLFFFCWIHSVSFQIKFQAIAQEYLTQYEVSLVRDFKTYVNFNICKLFIGLSIEYHEFLARTIHNSLGDFKWMIYFLFTLSNQQLKDMQSYFALSMYFLRFFSIGDKT